MMIVLHPAPVLEEPATPVDLTDPGRLELAADLIIALADTPGALAVAAQQIGETKRMFAYRTPAGDLDVLVNPTIVETRGKRLGKERCLSFVDRTFLVVRPEAVVVRSFTLEGDPQRHRWSGGYARMACHEVDHLDGVLVTSRARQELR